MSATLERQQPINGRAIRGEVQPMHPPNTDLNDKYLQAPIFSNIYDTTHHVRGPWTGRANSNKGGYIYDVDEISRFFYPLCHYPTYKTYQSLSALPLPPSTPLVRKSDMDGPLTLTIYLLTLEVDIL